MLKNDNYNWNDNILMLQTITRGCRIINDTFKERLLIKRHLLEVMLFELGHVFSTQNYLLVTYRALFALAYYGLFRIGELAKGDHPIKACDVHIAQNKMKILIYLRTSKTHGLESRPQKVKICVETRSATLHFCPFQLLRHYIVMRGDFSDRQEQFFILKGKIPITAEMVRKTLKRVLTAINLNVLSYQSHSFSIGRCCDLLKCGYTVEQIQILGRWRSNAVYKYLH